MPVESDTDDEMTMLTIAAKHSFKMKSRVVLHTASLCRSKFIELEASTVMAAIGKEKES